MLIILLISLLLCNNCYYRDSVTNNPPSVMDVQQAIKVWCCYYNTRQCVTVCPSSLNSLHPEVWRNTERPLWGVYWDAVRTILQHDRLYSIYSPPHLGPRQTFFAYQATRFADLYATSCTSLLHYSTDFHFIAPHSLVCVYAYILYTVSHLLTDHTHTLPTPTY